MSFKLVDSVSLHERLLYKGVVELAGVGLSLRGCVWTRAPRNVIKFRQQLTGVCSFPPSHGAQRSNSVIGLGGKLHYP